MIESELNENIPDMCPVNNVNTGTNHEFLADMILMIIK